MNSFIHNKLFHYMGEADGDGGDLGGASDTTTTTVDPVVTPPPTSDTDWRTVLGDEYKNDPVFKDLPDIKTLAKNHKDLQSHLGNSIRIPSQEADDAQWGEFRNKLHTKVPGLIALPKDGDEEGMKSYRKALGIPDDPKEYSLDDITGKEIQDERLDFLKGLAHKHNLTPTQFKSVLSEVVKSDLEAVDAQMTQVKESRGEIYKEWGEAFKDRVTQINEFLERSGAPAGLLESAKSEMVGGETLKWLHSMVAALGGEANNLNLHHQQTPNNGRLDPAEAMQRADEIYEQLMKLNQGDPQYDVLVKKRFEYIKMANPSASRDINQLRANTAGD